MSGGLHGPWERFWGFETSESVFVARGHFWESAAMRKLRLRSLYRVQICPC